MNRGTDLRPLAYAVVVVAGLAAAVTLIVTGHGSWVLGLLFLAMLWLL